MMFDDIDDTRDRLVEQLDAACKALDFMREHSAEEILGTPAELEWSMHWNTLNSARVAIQTAGEYLHDELNDFHEQMVEARADHNAQETDIRKLPPASSITPAGPT